MYVQYHVEPGTCMHIYIYVETALHYEAFISDMLKSTCTCMSHIFGVKYITQSRLNMREKVIPSLGTQAFPATYMCVINCAWVNALKTLPSVLAITCNYAHICSGEGLGSEAK